MFMVILALGLFLFDIAIDPVTVSSGVTSLWTFLLIGYVVTVAIETPILIVGLSKKLSLKSRFLSGLWLTGCTYPIVVVVLPVVMMFMQRTPRWQYLIVAEIFAPLAECLLFWIAFRHRGLMGKDWARCFVAIVVANLVSFGLGEVINSYGWFGVISW